MKILLLAAAAVFAATIPSGPDVSGFRYERTFVVPAAGQSCAVLDAAVFAHAVSQSLDDMRLYRIESPAHFVEVPFLLAVNDTQTTEEDSAEVIDLREEGSAIDFDLKMPPRPHSSVALGLAAKDFLGTAIVSGRMTPSGQRTPLGTFAVFDLSSRHLSRSTMLPMQETNFPLLHVQLHLRSAGGGAMPPAKELVREAVVPPSRQAQRLYTVVASTSDVRQVNTDSIAVLHLPEHVPAERIRFVISPEYHSNFQRSVDVSAKQDGVGSDEESDSGTISRVDIAPSEIEPIPIDTQSATVDTAFAANFRSGATMRIVVHNAGQPTLPLQAVYVEMRQRQICFDAKAAGRYGLFYGATGEEEAANGTPMLPMKAQPLVAELGPEILNSQYAQRKERNEMLERQPDLIWVCSAGVLAILGSIALRIRRKRQS